MHRFRFAACALTAVAVSVAATAGAQTSARDSAFALEAQDKFAPALAILERLIAAGTTDASVYSRAGFIVLRQISDPDAAERKRQRVRARSYFGKAMQLGLKDVQVQAIYDAIPEDGGSDGKFSDRKDVSDAMAEAEAAFGKSDYQRAFEMYQKALALDPRLYDAALFSGDTYLHRGPVDSAYVWYERATQIDPNRETAWRYWSDVLLKNKQLDGARDKAIEAIVADPYNRVSRQAFSVWARSAPTPLASPRIELPAIDTSHARAPMWTAYDSVRKNWKGTDPRGGAGFVAKFPNDLAYKHTLVEEKTALQAGYRAGGAEPTSANLRRLDEMGLLDAFIFFQRADQSIASEYDAYRRDHRADLRRFWTDFVIGTGPAK